jgi:hypothetical protein
LARQADAAGVSQNPPWRWRNEAWRYRRRTATRTKSGIRSTGRPPLEKAGRSSPSISTSKVRFLGKAVPPPPPVTVDDSIGTDRCLSTEVVVYYVDWDLQVCNGSRRKSAQQGTNRVADNVPAQSTVVAAVFNAFAAPSVPMPTCHQYGPAPKGKPIGLTGADLRKPGLESQSMTSANVLRLPMARTWSDRHRTTRALVHCDGIDGCGLASLFCRKSGAKF